MIDMIRAWDKESKNWMKDFVLLKDGSVCRIITEIYKGTSLLGEAYHNAVANSYIGMNDADQNMIFDDDIVIISIKEESGSIRKVVGVIKAISPSFVLATNEGIYSLDCGVDLKVIGNIWEHPERFYQTPVLLH